MGIFLGVREVVCVFCLKEKSKYLWPKGKNVVDCYIIIPTYSVLPCKNIIHLCPLPCDLQCFPAVKVYFSISQFGMIIWLPWVKRMWVQVTECQFSRKFKRHCVTLPVLLLFSSVLKKMSQVGAVPSWTHDTWSYTSQPEATTWNISQK